MDHVLIEVQEGINRWLFRNRFYQNVDLRPSLQEAAYSRGWVEWRSLRVMRVALIGFRDVSGPRVYTNMGRLKDLSCVIRDGSEGINWPRSQTPDLSKESQ